MKHSLLPPAVIMGNSPHEPNSALDGPFRPKPVPPRFLLELEPGHLAFFGNLRDLLLFRRTPKVEISSPPASFWPDVFVPSRLPWLQFGESLIVHAAVLALLWATGRILALQPHIVTQSAFHKDDVIYYSPSEYLQAIDTGRTAAAQPRKGEPEYARQPIISVPPEADNRSQTIITPPDVKLNHDVPVPNIVAWDAPAPAPPLPQASTRAVPNFTTPVVPPSPDVTQAVERHVDISSSSAIAPAPAVQSIGMRPVTVPSGSVVAPPPNLPRGVRLSDINIAPSQVVAPAPELPVQAQRTLGQFTTMAGQQTKIVPPPPLVDVRSGTGVRRGGSTGIGIGSAAQVVPPAPSVQNAARLRGTDALKTGSPAVVGPPPTIPSAAGSLNSGRQLIALSLHPAVGPPPANVEGNRRGAFSATPQGKPGAAGTPEVSGHSSGGNGNGGGSAGHEAGLPSGIHVGPAPNGAAGSQSAGNAGADGSATGTTSASNRTLLADNHPMRVTVSPEHAAGITNAPSALERQVFGDRKSYGMVLNMPNLNSGGGSWVIRFAELKESVAAEQGNLVAPEATHKVDPGYPLELMRQNVRGTVTLYAVIHSDGTVGDVKVLDSPDERLDEFARTALTRWHFKPALKNGVPVALEAVVRIPFKPARGW